MLTPEQILAIRHEIATKNLLLREWTGEALPGEGGMIAGAIFPETHPFQAGDIVSAPVLATTKFGPAIHIRAEIQINEKGDTDLKVVGMAMPVSYAIVPCTFFHGWRPAVRGLDT